MAYYNQPYMQPFGGGYPQMQTFSPQSPQFSPQSQNQQNSGIIWVQGEAGAKAWAVAPGQSVTLMDSENPALYLKSADMSGMPSMRIFDLVERVAKPNVQQTPQIDMSQYITRKEFEELKISLRNEKAGEQNAESSV